MPVYEYACTNCGERTEARQSFTDPPLETCGICGGKLRKLFSPVGIVFKGSGFYATDARKKSSTGSSSSESKDPGTSEKKTEKKSETKAETKSSSSGADKGSAPKSSRSD
jgi:putative FmdB family regulatory protein